MERSGTQHLLFNDILGVEKAWLAADFEADVADGFVVGEQGWLAADFVGAIAFGR